MRLHEMQGRVKFWCNKVGYTLQYIKKRLVKNVIARLCKYSLILGAYWEWNSGHIW